MTQDDDFSRFLVGRVDALAPVLTVETTRVVRSARRRRAVARSGGAFALVLVLGGAGWVLDTEPWRAPALAPAGQGVLRVAGEDGATPGPTTAPTGDVAPEPVAPGWPDAAYWHVLMESRDTSGAVSERHEFWLGHTEPGLLVFDGDLTTASGVGPSSWGNLLIGGTWTLISWDALYALPTDSVALEGLLRGSVEPDRGAGTDDDKVFGMARDLQLDSPAPPALRTALWAVMAALPAATVTTGVSDAAGRSGSLIEYTDALGGGYAMVFDPADGRLLEQRSLGGVSTMVEEGPATDTPIEPTLESSGCTAWATC